MSKADAVPSIIGYGSRGSKLCARVDISKASEVDDVNIDDTVSIVIKGKVKRLEGPEQFKDTDYVGNGKSKEVIRKIPGTIEIELESMKVMSEGDFSGMLED
jgi:hypothetical protein